MNTRTLAGAPDPDERLSADDMATRREEEFLAAAMRHQAQQTALQQLGPQGECANCGAQCQPLARYCDDDCRADHEHRRTVLARQGRAR